MQNNFGLIAVPILSELLTYSNVSYFIDGGIERSSALTSS